MITKTICKLIKKELSFINIISRIGVWVIQQLITGFIFIKILTNLGVKFA